MSMPEKCKVRLNMNKINISFQSGVFKEVIAVRNEKISLEELRNLATKFIQKDLKTFIFVKSKFEHIHKRCNALTRIAENKNYSRYGFNDALSDYLLLYHHDSNSANILQLITTINDISDGMLIEVVIGCKFHRIDVEG
ncbi:hypothetical protein LOAG_02478 [Loa loa]|uniref:Serine/threonine-protein kinase D1-3-like ubiquitin-like domain-containing protein n=1 Tax=Loa loa TaxID=7209 RepID=A0A1S0U6K3_LOALO|nr:hypothetical protein LOAG_02478 [Loa loa]EFO26006.1 hypothetical protein LOAG_02478 [Loa loa]